MGDKIPRFNGYLLTKYRKEKIEQIPEYLNRQFAQSMRTIESKFGDAAKIFKYVGYTELTPEERLTFLRDEVKYNRTYDIRITNVRTMRYDFQFNDERVSMFIDLPLMINHAVTLNGVDYYPLFAVVEVGGMSLDKDIITIRVSRANLRFFRDAKQLVTITTTSGQMTSAVNLTCKIHQRSRNRPPIILYLLAKHGFYKAMGHLGLDGKIMLSPTYEMEDPDNTYVKINDNLYLKINKESFNQSLCQRVIASLITIYKYSRKVDTVIAEGGYYYRVILGRLTFPSAPNNILREQNARDHLSMNESMLDEPSIENFKTVGLHVNTIDELIVTIFSNIDVYLEANRLNDLYNKKLASLDKLVSELIERFNSKLFNQIINAKPGLTLDAVKNLMFSAGQQCKWMIGSQLFRSMPTIINDNALLTITGKRFRAFGNIEMSKTAKRSKMPIDHLRSHPSSLIVESIQTVPTSGISNGSINPYLNIDSDGTFIIDEQLKKEVEHVFDT